MKVNSINSIYLISYLLFFIYISKTEALQEGGIIELKGALIDDVFESSIETTKNQASYYFYQLPSQNEKYMAITFKSKNYISNAKISCILSYSDDENKIKEELETNNICELYKEENNYLINALIPLSDYKGVEKLYFKFNFTSNIAINLYFRTKGSYKNKLESINEIKNGYAYTAFDFNKTDYYNKKQYLFISSVNDSILAFGKIGDRITQFDVTSILPITEQSLASIFWNYENIIIFVGKTKESDNTIKITLKDITEENINIRYYNGLQFDNDFISLYDNCLDEKTEYYLIVNYRNMRDNFFCMIHNLVGSDANLAELPINTEDIKSLTYKSVNKYTSQTKEENHLHVWKLKCPEDKSKLIANIKYTNKLNSQSSEKIKYININNFYTSGNEQFRLDYSGILAVNSTMFSLEIVTPESAESKEFSVNFEGKGIKVDNQHPTIFKIQDESKTELTIDMPEKDEAIISVIPSSIEKKYMFKEENKFESYLTGETGDYSYKAYYLEHEFDCNFNVSFEIENIYNEIVQVCSYVITMPLIQTNAQNCFLLPAKETKNITFVNIFKSKGDDNYKLEEPFYSPIIYINRYIQMKKLYLTTDLPKSTPIDQKTKIYNYYYIDAKLKTNEERYFNIHLTNSTSEKTFEIYILNEVSIYTSQLFDIKCVSAYEFALKYVENLFEDNNNNLCYFMNKDDYNSNVSHIIYKNTDDNKYHNFIIRIKPNYDMNIKIVIGNETNIKYDYPIIEKTIQIINTYYFFDFYEFNKTDLNKFSSYNNIIFYSLKDKIEIYGRKDNNFVQIDKNHFIRFTVGDFLTSDEYDKYLIGFGKTAYSEGQSLEFRYQLLTIDNLYYYKIEEFPGYYRIPINIKNCQKDKTNYIMLEYQNKEEKNISLANFTLSGNSKYVNYIDTFIDDEFEFEKGIMALNNFAIIKQNKLNLNVIKFTCENNYIAYFDYFTEISNTNIKLEEGIVSHYIIPKEQKLNFAYESINEIKIETKNSVFPKITFEKSTVELKENYLLVRSKNDTNEFYVETQSGKENIPLRVIPLVNLKNLEKSQASSDLYIIGNKFIYDIPSEAINVTLRIKPLSTRLRVLEEGMEICYIASKIVILNVAGGDCFNVKDAYDLGYSVPENNQNEKYLILYPSDSTKKFTVEKVDVEYKGGNNGQGGENKENDNNNDDGGSKAWLIILIIILVIIIIAITALLIFRMRRKRITNADIEKEVKRTPSLTAVTF